MKNNISQTLLIGASGMLGTCVENLFFRDKRFCLKCPSLEEFNFEDEVGMRKYISAAKPDLIINCAAYTAVDAAEDNVSVAEQLNTKAPGILAAAAKECGALLIHISTDYVFDGMKRNPYREDDETNPLNVYGQTKLMGERAIIGSGCRYVILRTQWLYDAAKNNFFNTMLRLFAAKSEIGVVADQYGSPTYAPHLAETVVSVASSFEMGKEGVYHYADRGECSWYDFAQTIAAHTVTQCRIRPLTTAEYPTKAVRPPYSVLDCSKVETAFGIVRQHWRAGVVEAFIEKQDRGL